MPPKHKCYAAFLPDGSCRTFSGWPACQQAVNGVSGALFKGFPDRHTAQAWLDQQRASREAAAQTAPGELEIFVDGAFFPSCPKAGWAWAAIRDGVLVAEAAGVTREDARSRNIDGETEAALRALEWLSTTGETAVIRHDYTGIAHWLTGDWKASTPIARAYVEKGRPLAGRARFLHVKGHSGNRWNDHVDRRAEEVLLDYIHRIVGRT